MIITLINITAKKNRILQALYVNNTCSDFRTEPHPIPLLMNSIRHQDLQGSCPDQLYKRMPGAENEPLRRASITII